MAAARGHGGSSTRTLDERLDLFLEQAQRLREGTRLGRDGIDFRLQINPPPDDLTVPQGLSGPSDEDLQGYMAVFRPFVLQTEDIFVKKLAKDIRRKFDKAGSSATLDELREELETIRSEWKYLLESGFVGPFAGTTELKGEDAIDYFLYGRYIHLDKDKKDVVDKWMKELVPYGRTQFLVTTMALSQLLTRLAALITTSRSAGIL